MKKLPFKLVLLALLVLMPLGMSAGFAGPAIASDALSDLAGKNRAILLFSRSRSDASLGRQLALLGDKRPELAERKVVVLLSAGNRDTMAVIGFARLPQGANRQLTARFAPAEQGLTVILVGLDGAEQGRWQHVVDPLAIIDLIDQMPEDKDTSPKPAVTN